MGFVKRVKFLPWSEDKWLSKNGHLFTYDKAEHALREFLLVYILFGIRHFLSIVPGWEIHALWVILIIELAGIGWEIKDGLVPYDGVHIEGFSWKDLIANNIGLLVGYWIYSLVMQ